MKITEPDWKKIEGLIYQAMYKTLVDVDGANINHPEWDEYTAQSMTDAAVAVAKAVHYSQEREMEN